MTTTETPDLANVPHPAGAIYVDDWHDTTTDNPGRYFRATSWEYEGGRFGVLVDGTQRADGTDSRFVTITENGDREAITDLTAERARWLGRALLAAADAVDGLQDLSWHDGRHSGAVLADAKEATR